MKCSNYATVLWDIQIVLFYMHNRCIQLNVNGIIPISYKTGLEF
ncbi:MAG TPA: hypothetical protein PLJ52_11440 [Tenuifilaceae bacterium]|nr:hypothetical protein [Tenuifilaceae bacterium]